MAGGVLVLTLAWHNAHAQNDPHVMAHAKSLCEFAKTHVPPGEPPAMRLCQGDESVTSDDAYDESQRWWNYWFDQNLEQARAAHNEFDKYLVHEKAATHENDFAAKARPLHEVELCVEYDSANSPAARKELERRKALTAHEWKLGEVGDIAIGMSELAVNCSKGLGYAENRLVGSWGEHIQCVYGNEYIYVENGKVVALQD
jgi:hypothetical protein